MFGFMESLLILQLGVVGASVDERAIALANRFQSEPK